MNNRICQITYWTNQKIKVKSRWCQLDLITISLKQALFLIKQNVHDIKLELRSHKGEISFLNDKFLNKAIKADEHCGNNIVVAVVGWDKSGPGYVIEIKAVKSLTLFKVEADINKSRQFGCFFFQIFELRTDWFR